MNLELITEEPYPNHWMASVKGIKAVGQGFTEDESIKELMLLIEIKLRHDKNNKQNENSNYLRNYRGGNAIYRRRRLH